jgi:hypothetical protein
MGRKERGERAFLDTEKDEEMKFDYFCYLDVPMEDPRLI